MNWSLNINNFTAQDRRKIADFILDENNRWTQDKRVQEYEQAMAKYIGCKYAVFVSSGSAANTLLSYYLADKMKDEPKRNIVVLPAVTWQTSCSPWIRVGFRPQFLDIDFSDFSIDKEKLEEFLIKNHDRVACIFPTSLIGYVPDMAFYKKIAKKYNVNVFFDNCENTLGEFNGKNVSSFFTSTTSTYFGHQLQSIEGGFIFTNDDEEYKYFLMNRNHGMTRSLDVYKMDKTKFLNKNVNPLFDFAFLGNNFRNTDVNAFIGLLDLKRIQKYKKDRISLYKSFYEALDANKFFIPKTKTDRNDVAFCLPIILKNHDKNTLNKIIDYCQQNKIEYRPIISGFLGYQTCYKDFFYSGDLYDNAKYVHEYGIYIGLHSGLKKKQIVDFVKVINKI